MDKIKDNFGASSQDISRGFKKVERKPYDPDDVHEAEMDMMWEPMEDKQGGFVGRAKGWER